MSETLDDKYFDYAFQLLNYALEFVKVPGYASLRFVDVLEKTANLALSIDGIEKKPFYEKLLERYKKPTVRGINMIKPQQGREELLNDLLSLFVDEWKKD